MERLALVRRFEFCRDKQMSAASRGREYAQAGMPLLAQSYFDECRYLGVLIIDSIEQLEAMDKQERIQ